MDKPEGYEGDIDGTIRRRRSNNNDKNSSSPKTVNQALTPVIRVMGWGLGLILVYAGFANMFWDDTSNSTIPYLLAGIFFLTISSARCKKFSASDMFEVRLL
jgi:hypothetical protein